MSALRTWVSQGFPKISLDAAGLVALADLSTVARRTAFTGTSALADTLILCPGLHRQQDAPSLNGGEYPICAAMTTGYVFRVENQATVLYLQKVGRAGHLTCLTVSNSGPKPSIWLRFFSRLSDFGGSSFVPVAAYVAAVMLTITVLALLVLLKDWWGLGVVGILTCARLINVLVIRHRAVMGWKGEPEPGQQSDLIILLSQDRWIRMRGAVDDVKAITSGEWLREPTFVESSLVAFATLLVYLDATLAGNSTKEGKVLLLVLLFCSAGLLGFVNEFTNVSKMYGRTITLDGPPQPYKRRLVLAKELIRETGRSDWAIRLGMAQPSDVEGLKDEEQSIPGSSGRHEDHPAKGNSLATQADWQVTL